MKKAILCMILAFVSVNAFALELMTGKVTLVEASYLPTYVVFQMDVGSASCPAGKYLQWSTADLQNNKSIYALLLTALVSQSSVNFYVNSGDTTCLGRYVHLLR